MIDLSFYKGKRVLITGHSGFKGSYMTKVLLEEGAIVAGYSLVPDTRDSLYNLLDYKDHITNVIADIRDKDKLLALFKSFKPEIVFHLAAQPLVLDSYENPHYTYETNVMGTVNLLECVRQTDFVKSVVNVTTDKVYKNNEWFWAYREDEPLDGYDPYSNSKSCSELVTHSYINSFFKEKELPVSTARAGNVIGGGDFSNNRIIVDCVQAQIQKEKIKVRNPYSTRPYQHVLEPVVAYLLIAKAQYQNYYKADFYNVGPDDCDCVTTGELVSLFCKLWGDKASWVNQAKGNAPHEANFLKLDCSKIKSRLSWSPRWHIEDAILKTCEFSKAYIQKEDLNLLIAAQIKEYLHA